MYFWLADRWSAARARAWRQNPVLPSRDGLIATCPRVGVYLRGGELVTVPELSLTRDQILDLVAWCAQNLSTTFDPPRVNDRQEMLTKPEFLPEGSPNLPPQASRLARYVDDVIDRIYGPVYESLTERFTGRPFGFSWQLGVWEVGRDAIHYSSRSYCAWFYSDGEYYAKGRKGDGKLHRVAWEHRPCELVLRLYQSLARGELVPEAEKVLVDIATEIVPMRAN